MIKIPFRDGNLLGYAQGELEWIDNFVFYDTIVYDGFERGRSSIKIIFKRVSNGKRVEMFMKDFDLIMKSGGFQSNHLTGHFTFQKRGQNYGIRKAEGETQGDE